MEFSTLTAVTSTPEQIYLRFHLAAGSLSTLTHRLLLVSVTNPSVSVTLLSEVEHKIGQQAEYEQLDELSILLYLNYAIDPIEVRGSFVQEQFVEPSAQDLIIAYARLAQLYHFIESKHDALWRGYIELGNRVAQQFAKSQEKRARLGTAHRQQVLRTEGQTQAFQYVLNVMKSIDQETAE